MSLSDPAPHVVTDAAAPNPNDNTMTTPTPDKQATSPTQPNPQPAPTQGPSPAPPPPPTQPPPVRYPPFPPKPPGVTILPFSQFKEHGIQIFTDPETGVEIDGLGIPTVRLRVPHDTDRRKTRAPPGAKVVPEDGEEGDGDGDGDGEGEGDEEGEGAGGAGGRDGRRKKKKKKKGGAGGGGGGGGEKRDGKDGPIDWRTIKDPIERAQEQKRQRLKLFEKRVWWEQWAEGEELRRGRIYDTNLSQTDRIHMAATEFRVGRMWPPSSTRLRYLWDQYRLFVGLLGATPVWIRTDLGQEENDLDLDSDDVSDDASEEFDPNASKKAPAVVPPWANGAGQGQGQGQGQNQSQSQRRKATVESDSEDEFAQARGRYSDEEEDEDLFDDPPPPDDEKEPSPTQPTKPPAPRKRKRIPPRPPYALYNLHPIPLSSPTHVPILLSLASAQRQAKLQSFLASPSLSTKIFLSSYIHSQGLVYSPLYLASLPRLVLFFLEFLVRARVLPEVQRELRAACAVARRAVEELPKAGLVCRYLPDAVGRGCTAIWGLRWVRDGWVIEGGGSVKKRAGERVQEAGEGEKGKEDGDGERGREETKEEAMRRFEEELRAENVQLMPANPDDLGMPPEDEEKGEEGGVSPPLSAASSLSSVEEEDEEGGGFIEEVVEQEVKVQVVEAPAQVAQEGGTVLKEDEKTRHDASPAPAQPLTAPPSTSQANDASKHTPDAPNWALAPDDPPAPPNLNPSSSSNSTPAHPLGTLPTDWIPAHTPSDPTPAEHAAYLSTWLDPPSQPLLPILGPMSVFPLCFSPGGRGADVGVAERSMRRVREVWRSGEDREREGGGQGEGEGIRKNRDEVRRAGWRVRGVEEDLVDKFARVVLEPWTEWGTEGVSGGVGDEFRVPEVQGPAPLPSSSSSPSSSAPGDDNANEDDDEELKEIKRRRLKYAHDPHKDAITLLVEPRVAENMVPGMGLAGTWVQLVPIVNPFDRWEPGARSGGARGRGRGGRGRGGGRGGGGERGGRGGRGGGGERGGRGRGRGRGGAPQGDHGSHPPSEEQHQQSQPQRPAQHTQPTQQPQRSPTFWYVEEIYMAVPSYWTVGEPEEDLRQLLEDALVERGESLGGSGKGVNTMEGGGEVTMVLERD